MEMMLGNILPANLKQESSQMAASLTAVVFIRKTGKARQQFKSPRVVYEQSDSTRHIYSQVDN